jgi:hypothetical protein
MKWAPSIPSVVYHGSKDERAEIRGSQLRKPGSSDFPVVVTTYDILLRDIEELKRFPWRYIVVDNCPHALLQELSGNLLMLSDTPLPNSVAELAVLLDFVDSTSHYIPTSLRNNLVKSTVVARFTPEETTARVRRSSKVRRMSCSLATR